MLVASAVQESAGGATQQQQQLNFLCFFLAKHLLYSFLPFSSRFPSSAMSTAHSCYSEWGGVVGAPYLCIFYLNSYFSQSLVYLSFPSLFLFFVPGVLFPVAICDDCMRHAYAHFASAQTQPC